MKNIHKLKLEVGENILAGIKVAVNKSDVPNCLFLHGGGSADKYRTLYLTEKLLEKNISSVVFDHRGSGESDGEMNESSLRQRYEEAQDVLKNFLDSKNLTICGSSIGGYVALKMLELGFKIENLILFCPGIYDKKAFEVSFNDEFSKIIRQKESWKNSDIFALLEKFKGNLLIIIGENDAVIPGSVIELLDKHSSQVRKKEIIKLKGVGHSVHKTLIKDESLASFVADKIEAFVKCKF